MLTITLAGRLGRDAELRSTPAGKSVCNFSVAVDVRRGQDKSTTWVDCTLWEKRAEALAPHLKKGTAVAVAGEFGLRQYDKRDGSAGIAVECAVRELTLLGGGERKGDANGDAYDWKRAEREQAARPAAAPTPSGGDPFSDDIPFAPAEYRSIA